MDKKNTIIGIGLLLAAFGTFFFNSKMTPPPAKTPAPVIASESSPVEPRIEPVAEEGLSYLEAAQEVLEQAEEESASAVEALSVEKVVVTLENDFIEVHFSNHGGAVEGVLLKKFEAVQGEEAPYVFNRQHFAPILSLVGFPGANKQAVYSVHSQTRNEVVFRIVVEERLEIFRSYRITDGQNGQDPYEIRHETTFRNLTDRTLVVPDMYYHLGTAEPISANIKE
ncbi:MAG: hypothetical protein JKY51_09070 [Opitutaceae bacterium]|nr:hypothetical protein [Opitutaceae bacterium]